MKHKAINKFLLTTGLVLTTASASAMALNTSSTIVAAAEKNSYTPTTGDDSITIKPANGIDLSQESFNAYQLMTAEKISDTEEKYTIIPAWQDFFNQELQKFNTSLGLGYKDANGTSCTSEQAHKMLTALYKDPKQFKTFKEDAYDYIEKNKIPKSGEGSHVNGDYKISGLPNGYYIVIEDQTTSTKVVSKDMLVTLDSSNKNAEITLKADAPSLLKTIDVNGDADGGDKKAVDAAIGDTINFKLVSKVPMMDGYSKYTMTVNDTMSKGLTLNSGSFKVKIGNTTYDNFYVNTTSTSDGTKFTLQFGGGHDGSSNEDNNFDILNDSAFKGQAGKPITITYTATVNDDAVLGKNANDNTANMQYSSNPYQADQTAKTPDSKVKVYSFGLDITKQNTQKTVLPGAEFELKTDGGSAIHVKADVTRGEGHYVVTKETSGTGVTTKIVSDSKGKIYIDGLDAGSYQLVETKAPDGYNLLTSPITFKITPSYSNADFDASHQMVKLPELTGITTDNDSVTSDVNTGYVATTVINKTGGLLPQTGGRGIMMIIIAGLALMGIATYLLFFRSKKAEQ